MPKNEAYVSILYSQCSTFSSFHVPWPSQETRMILTLEQLQGSWFHSEGFARIIISGDQATVIRYSVGITYSGTVQFRDDGFIVEGDYYHLDSDDTTPAGKAKATFIITKFTESYFVDAFDDRGPYTWYRE